MSDALLLPSAILVPDELRLDLGEIPTGMIPLHGKPVLRHIIAQYDDVDPYVACGERADLISAYLDREGLDWSLIDVGSPDSLGATIQHSIDQITNEHTFDDNGLYINFADTIVSPHRSGASDLVSYALKRNQIRWTSFEGDDRITSVTRKQNPKVNGDSRVFTGVFRLSQPAAYQDALTEALTHDTNEPDPFYQGLLRYLSDRQYELVEADRWIDVGHIDTYYEAKKEFLNVRDFNRLDTDSQTNVITKSSTDSEKIRSEYEWYTTLPANLEPFSPRVYEYDDDDARLQLEYVGYPSLRDLFLHSSHGLHVWNHIFESLFRMLETFSDHRTSNSTQTALRSMYIDKTRRRLAQVDTEGPLEPLFRNEVTINGTTYPGVPHIVDGLESDLEAAGLFSVDEFTVMHGDLCFSNILFDLRNGIIKLIDPRGEFGPHIIYGDPRYDLAKLRHSVAGNYDFIINDMFDIDVDQSDGRINFEVYRTAKQNDCQKLFESLLGQQYPEWKNDVRLIESLLFLSMVPLHDDKPQRQQYMLARGIKQFNQTISG